MALHGMIQVNSISIGWWSAVRGWDGPEPSADDVVVYNCQVEQKATLQGNPPVNWQGQVLHRFGDGALALASEVLAAAHAASQLEVRLPAAKQCVHVDLDSLRCQRVHTSAASRFCELHEVRL